MKCDECSLRLWCISIPYEFSEGGGSCIIASEVADCVMNLWSSGDLKSYYNDDDDLGYNLPREVRRAIVDRFENYIEHFAHMRLGFLLERIIKEDIKEGSIK